MSSNKLKLRKKKSATAPVSAKVASDVKKSLVEIQYDELSAFVEKLAVLTRGLGSRKSKDPGRISASRRTRVRRQESTPAHSAATSLLDTQCTPIGLFRILAL